MIINVYNSTVTKCNGNTDFYAAILRGMKDFPKPESLDLVVPLLTLVVLLLLAKHNQQTSENAEDIIEQIQSVANTIVASHAMFFHDHLCIKQNETSHHGQSQV